MAKGNVDWENEDIRVILVDDAYVPDVDAHANLDDILVANRYGNPDEPAVTLAGRSVVNVAGGIAECRATVTTFPSVALEGAKDVGHVIGYKHTGVESTSTLLFVDTLVLDKTPDGNNINYTPAADGCMKLDG